jgi:hypothetical protein
MEAETYRHWDWSPVENRSPGHPQTQVSVEAACVSLDEPLVWVGCRLKEENPGPGIGHLHGPDPTRCPRLRFCRLAIAHRPTEHLHLNDLNC